MPGIFFLAGFALVAGSLFELLVTGETHEHGSRFIVMTFLFSTGMILLMTRVIDYVLVLVEERVRYWKKTAEKGDS